MKVEDLTLKEIKEICKKYRHGRVCNDKCPILIECDVFFRECPCRWYVKDMEREVEE